MDRQPGPALAVVHPQPPDPGGDRGDRVGPLAGGDAGAQPDEGVAPGIALAVPGPAPTDGDLDLDHRLQPVDVRALEQADLDQSHGPAQDSNPAGRVDWPPMTTGTTGHRSRDRRPPGVRSPPTCRPTWPTSSSSSTSTAALHAGGRRRGRPLDGRASCPISAPTSTSARTRGPLRRHGRRRRSRAGPDGATGPADRAHGHGLRPGDRGRAAVPDRRRHRARPGRHRHEVGAARRPLRAQGDHRRARRRCPSSA